ncbi:MAG: YncE family protein [Gammaproteobacteria bacterium]
MKLPARFALSLGALLLIFFGIAAARTSAASYHLLKSYHYGPAENATGEYFDYISVDTAARRVYLGRGTEVQVIDSDTGKLLGRITGFKRQHGVAVAHPFNRGFITDGGAGTVTIFDLRTLKRIRTVTAQPDADCVVYDPVSRRIFTMNGDPESSTIIDAHTGKVIKTIPLGGAPEFAVADGHGMIYANLASTNQIVAIDTRTMTIKSRWSSAPAGHPTAMAIDTVHRRLFSAGREPAVLDILDADTGKVIQSFPITDGVDAARFDPVTGDVFVSTFTGRLHIFHENTPNSFTALPAVTTEMGAKTMGLDLKTHEVFVDTANFTPPPPGATGRARRPRAALGTYRVLVYGP